MEYETVIGLEVHAQLLTESKLFCACSTTFGDEPNSNTCPVCTGMPGVLPVLNRKAVEFAMRMAFATNCKINPRSIFARKNYFYPDLPKGYQISMLEEPLAEHGWVDIKVNGDTKRIGLTRIHLEDDAGKLIHASDGTSLVDLNRTGTPLIEIVSEPDMRTPEEAAEYMKAIRDILSYIEVCDCNMEEGSLRCDANVSIRPKGSAELGTKAELKNMNSFKFVRLGLEYEISRQTDLVEDGEKVIQETRLFDPDKGITSSMRSKEEAHDYRYFPEPDLLPVDIDEAWMEEVKSKLPELKEAKIKRFIDEYKLPEYDAEVLAAEKAIADYFEATVKKFPQAKKVSNWIMGEVMRELKEGDKGIEDFPITPGKLAGLLELMDKNVISGKIGKTVFGKMYDTGEDASAIVEKEGLKQVTDEGAIAKAVDEVIVANPSQVEEYIGGKDKVIGFFVGQIMKATKGKANPQSVNKLLKEKLDKLKNQE